VVGSGECLNERSGSIKCAEISCLADEIIEYTGGTTLRWMLLFVQEILVLAFNFQIRTVHLDIVIVSFIHQMIHY